jgi:nicotinamide-nucleotide amidase
MQTSLIIVGQSLSLNKPFLEYIFLHVQKYINSFDATYYFDNNDKNILLNLEKIINESEQIIIVSSKNSFNTISKILCTLSQDSLELKAETLIPSKSPLFSKDSYKLLVEEKPIYAICALETQTLPPLHVEMISPCDTFFIVGLDEDSTKILLEPLAATYDVKLVTTKIVEGFSKVKAIASKYGDIESFIHASMALFPDKIIKNDNIMEHIVSSLKQNNKTLSTAESCTGGLIASLITSVSGSSEVFHGGVVSYSNDIKRSWLGVSKETLQNYGAVSELCLREMMEGVLNASNSDFAVATSGIAGPSGGSVEKPVGTVFVGARDTKGEVLVERVLLQGDRNYIQHQSCYHALRLLLLVGKEYFFKK